MQSSAILYPPRAKSITASLKPKGLSLYPFLQRRRKCFLCFKFPPQPKEVFQLSAVNEPPPSPLTSDSGTDGEKPSPSQEEEAGGIDLSWLPAFPHVLTASMSNFLFGYHIGVMNGPIVAIARELGFEGNSFLEGLVVSIFIAGAFIGSICSASFVDKFGCRRALQIDTIPLILGALLSAQAHSLDEMLWGRFLVGLGIGLNTVLVPLYISEVEDNSIYCICPWFYSYSWYAVCC